LPFTGRPPLARLLPRVYYGWILAVGASLNAFIVVGIGFYAMAVFLDALCGERGWTRTSVSFATTLYFITTGLVGPLIGRGVDRAGPRVFIALGAPVMAGALLAVGRVEEPWQLWIVYPVLAIGFAMTGAVPASAIVTRWFASRRAVAMSIAQTGVSVGGVVLVPWVTRILLEEGIAAATERLAVLVLAIVLPVTALVLRAAFGFLPEVGDLFIIIAVGVVIALVVFYPRLPPEATPTRLALGLVVGGALGNALDRLQYGHVVDFIHYQIPGLISNVSNLADHAVVLGVIIILIDSWRIDRIRAQAEATESALVETTLDTDTSEYPPVERSQT
jgi:lipoprotein signal peptidase